METRNLDKKRDSNSTSKWPRTERFWGRVTSLRQRLLKGKVKAVDTLPLKKQVTPTSVGDEGILKEGGSDESPKTEDESPKES
jgi:hypothetical protein